MSLGFKEYLSILYQRIPDYVYEGGLSLFVLGVVVFILLCGFKNGWRKIAALLLGEHIALLYCSTVVFREPLELRKYNAFSFEFYKDVIETVLAEPEMLLNILVFVPIGFLTCMAFKRAKWWQVLMMGCGLSVSIEILQFFFKRGTTEVGDVILNTLGCAIGLLCYLLARLIGWMFHEEIWSISSLNNRAK